VFVHWSVPLLLAVLILGATQKPLDTILGAIAYIGIFVIHEAGHLIVARRRGYEPISIELYPILGIARFEAPRSRFDRTAIAWGGVAAQAIIGIPVAMYIATVDYTPFGPLNTALAILGDFSLVMAVFNLLPFPPLDGSIAWDIVPAYIERRRSARNRRPTPYRSSR